MRRIGRAAEERGYHVEYVLCSGDPNSLDGIYIQELKLAYTDGTHPHVQEVLYPAVRGAYLDLGAYYNQQALIPHSNDIIALSKGYKKCYSDAYEELSRYKQPDSPVPIPKRKERFYSAITCNGIVNLPYPYPIQSVSNEQLTDLCYSADAEAIVCLHPLWPNTITALIQKETVYEYKMQTPNCDTAVQHLKAAKQLHDQLENIYNPHVDFDAIYRLAEKHIEKYL